MDLNPYIVEVFQTRTQIWLMYTRIEPIYDTGISDVNPDVEELFQI